MSNTIKLPDSEMASVHRRERREARYEVPFEVEVTGIDAEGKVFHLRAFTRNVSQWGCGFLSPLELKKDDIIAIRLVPPTEVEASQRPQVRFQVVRVEREGQSWAIGAWKMDTDNVWGVELERIALPQLANKSQRKAEKPGSSHESRDQ